MKTILSAAMALLVGPTQLATLTLLAVPAFSQAQEIVTLERTPFAERIGARHVSFVARDLETGTRYVLEGSEPDVRHAPWSTFKIPNFLIALETGIVSDIDAVSTWDRSRRPALNYWPDSWRREQSLRTAFQRSAVWYFQDIALEIETQTYRTTLADWDYGVADIADGSDNFWLNRGLEISVNEQVAFLEQLHRHELHLDGQRVSGATLEALYDVSLARQIDEYGVHGKTGSGPVRRGDFSGPFDGWYVGFIQRQEALPVVFALYARGQGFSSVRTFRQDFATQLLIEAELLPTVFGQ